MLLEQLAENEQNPLGGPSELDMFLAGGPADGDLQSAFAGSNVQPDGSDDRIRDGKREPLGIRDMGAAP
jgi:hypothetical protein